MKTLKDMEKFIYVADLNNINFEEGEFKAVKMEIAGAVNKEELRQLAIEWIKEFERIEKTSHDNPSWKYSNFEDVNSEGVSNSFAFAGESDFRGVKRFIKHFFNIEDKDLL